MKNPDHRAWLPVFACVLAALALSTAPVEAKPVVRNLGGGLQQIATLAGRAKSLAADPKGQKVVESRVAGLVLDAAGGPGTVKPNRMRRILQASAFPHDLDPHFSSGNVQTGVNLLTIGAAGDLNGFAQFDPNFFTLWHGGPKRVRTFSINLNASNPTGSPKGVVFDERPGLGLPFTVGRAIGLDPSDVTTTFTQPANPPGGARIFGKYEDGTPFDGNFTNAIGSGYSPLDGYGFINAEAAINAVREKKQDN